MAKQHTPDVGVLQRQQARLYAILDAISQEGEPHPRLAGLVQHAQDLLDTMVAEHAALSRENARLRQATQRRAARIATINRIGRLITSSLGLDEILQMAIEAISEDLHFADLGLMLVDPDNPEMLVLRAKTGTYSAIIPIGYRQSCQHGVIGVVARTRQRILLNDVSSDPWYIPTPGVTDVCAELAVPVVVGDRLLGVLNVESTRPVSEEDAADLEIVADQLAVAIDNAHLFARTQQALSETRLLYETSRRMSTAMDVDEVIKAYLEQVAERGRYICTVVLYEFDEAGQRTAVIVRGRWTPQGSLTLGEERLPHTRDAFDPLLDAGQTVIIADFRTDPRVSAGLRRIQARHQRLALAMIPLMVHGQRIGLVVLSYPHVHQWCEADLQPYQATAAQLAAAIESRRQHLLLIERGQQLAVLEERQRLARELHDSVTQLIFSMTLIAQSIIPAWRRDPAEGKRRLQRLLELSQSTLVEMRALLAELRPAEDRAAASGTVPAITSIARVRRDGLVVALRLHVTDVARDGLQINLDTDGYVRQPREQEEALYRIVQEALNNVIRHARARRVAITLSLVNHTMRLTVKDDGRGFALELASVSDDAHYPPYGGFGLKTMKERAEALGGRLQVISTPGHGTVVDVTLPQKDA
jgi:signal transduction histidine kinase/putative methionine-R-sulfoxide reductase with GAF domain